jgi:HNH endonuclease/NUMOD4 motif
MTEWRTVPGWDGYYEVSNTGRVRSRRCALKPNLVGGYPTVYLYRPGQKKKQEKVHRLVLLAFVGPAPDGHEALHDDGDRENPTLSNLKWGTRKQNVEDTLRHGMHAMANREECPRGHELVVPNLVMSTLAKGRRDCRSCSNARAMVWTNPSLDFVQQADLRYAELMGFTPAKRPSETCSRGHLLAGANLRFQGSKRRCVACGQTHSACRRNPRLDFQIESDRRYQLLMDGPALAVASRHDAAQGPAQVPAQRGPGTVTHLVRDSAATGGGPGAG